MAASVLVVDDQESIRSALCLLLQSEPHFEVIGEAADGAEAVAQARTRGPDVVLMDVRMPRLDGIAATEQLMRFIRPPKVLMLTNCAVDDRVLDALEAGAAGFLLKDLCRQQLTSALRTVLAGGRAVSPEVLDSLVHRASPSGWVNDTGLQQRLAQLSESERRVLELIRSGMTNAQIARQLFLSQTSVKTYVSRMLTKLGLENRTQAAILAYEARLTGIDR
ncbi:response regulator transcription factor [Streptomyces sp. AV19]|uniref:response regulator transcription factor n=1 Tax=Streptomyces sp. AV19 TaxID=2793068 RepID=UPI0018FE8F02|nr:response regulator transcription factor [Streptomyces sp. AV19]MBH1938999.1 response regulator transcription factor [Streptomyces sp. AV19]MDG4536869.1 response regulator transcription factor [Streptomyces sp. AV19]